MSSDGAFHKPAVASLIRMASLKRLELSPNCLEELETSRHAIARPTACPPFNLGHRRGSSRSQADGSCLKLGLHFKMKCSSGPGCQNDEMLHLWLLNPERNNSGGISSSLGRFPLCHYTRIELGVFRYRSLLYLSEVIKWKTPLGQSEG
jgi:hypothetical protein